MRYTNDDSLSVMARIEALSPLVKRIAYHLMARLPPSVEVDDLIQVGLMGLMDAAQHFDASQGVQFESYATQRIRGSMLDELRKMDWLPRNVRRSLRKAEEAIHQLEHQLGRPPLEQEIADQLGIALSEYQTILTEGRGHQLVYYEDFRHDDQETDILDTLGADANSDPLVHLADAGFRDSLVEAIGRLPDREKLMMALYYEQDLNLKEIGEVMGVSESRVSQIHSQAVARLRTRLREWLEHSNG